jgi:hypothetical protein
VAGDGVYRHMGVKLKRPRAKVLALVAVCLTAGVGACRAGPVPARESANTPAELVPPTGFGGYSWWAGDVRQVSARWRVPLISPASAAGHASTWVGAQSAAGGYPFVQVGVTEDTSGGGRAQYHAFWSDTKAGFHPQYLGPVRARDMVAVGMDRQKGGWKLMVWDLTRRTRMSRVVRYGGGAVFNQAEWLQEDPTASTAVAVDLPYPRMSGERFLDVKVNGATPRLGLANGQSLMATGGTILVPTAFRHDGFAMVVPRGAGKQYLADVSPLDFAINAYNFELTSWDSLAVGARAATVEALMRAYATFAERVVGQAWPAAARGELALLASNDTRLDADLTAWLVSGLGRGSSQFFRLEEDQDNDLGQAVRYDLGLPRV